MSGSSDIIWEKIEAEKSDHISKVIRLKVGGYGKIELAGFLVKLNFTRNRKDRPRRRFRTLTKVCQAKIIFVTCRK